MNEYLIIIKDKATGATLNESLRYAESRGKAALQAVIYSDHAQDLCDGKLDIEVSAA